MEYSPVSFYLKNKANCCFYLSKEHNGRCSCLQSQRTLFPSQDSDGGARALFREMRFLFLYRDGLRG